MTEAERIAEKCPTCHQPPGRRCIDPKGDQTPRSHRTRGPGQADAHLAAALDRKEAREKASYGPLFQELAAAEVTRPTLEVARLRERMAAARSFDAAGPVGMALCDKANAGMQWLRVWSMLNEIGRRRGENWQEAIRAQVLEGFENGIEYVPPRLKALMTTTEPDILAWFRHEDPETKKVKVVPALVWQPPEPLMTEAEFDARFRMPDHFRGLRDAPEPDDGGLFETTVGRLTTQETE